MSNVRIRWWVPLVAIAAAWLLALFACSNGYIRQQAHAGDLHTMRVEQVVSNPRLDWFQRSGWYNPNRDLTMPSRVYVSGMWACVLQTPEVNEPLPGDYYACLDGWRPQSNAYRAR